MIFKTKAETLKDLTQVLSEAKVLPLYIFSVGEWEKNRDKIIADLSIESWINEPIIVRSSSLNEDTENESMAGKFESILNVNFKQNFDVCVEEVISSFANKSDGDLVFVQPMLQGVERSGVCFTRDPSNSAHYYLINYDDSSGKTDTVTGGTSGELKTLLVAKTIKTSIKEKWVQDLIKLCKELEKIFCQESLDIEFGFDKKGQLYLFQVRPLILKKEEEISLDKQKIILRQIKNKVASLSKPFPHLAGKKSILGVMPDWNPAEIIGIRRGALALSLYKEFITDGVWAESRSRYGYRNLRGFPLLIDLGGIPFIDVRVSFNSFVPASLDQKVADKLIEYYISELEKAPKNHDKIEFEVIFSCYTFDIDDRLNKLKTHGFSEREISAIKESLKEMTNNIINNNTGVWREDEKLIEYLKERQEMILDSNLNEVEKMYWLTEDCKRYGTLPFAGSPGLGLSR